jgi:hypothetical protein
VRPGIGGPAVKETGVSRGSGEVVAKVRADGAEGNRRGFLGALWYPGSRGDAIGELCVRGEDARMGC